MKFIQNRLTKCVCVLLLSGSSYAYAGLFDKLKEYEDKAKDAARTVQDVTKGFGESEIEKPQNEEEPSKAQKQEVGTHQQNDIVKAPEAVPVANTQKSNVTTAVANQKSAKLSTPSSDFPAYIKVYKAPYPNLFKNIVFPAMNGIPVFGGSNIKWMRKTTYPMASETLGLDLENSLFGSSLKTLFDLHVLRVVHDQIDKQLYVDWIASSHNSRFFQGSERSKHALYQLYFTTLSSLDSHILNKDKCYQYLSSTYKKLVADLHARTDCNVSMVHQNANAFETRRRMNAYLDEVVVKYLEWSEKLGNEFEFIEITMAPLMQYDFSRKGFILNTTRLSDQAYGVGGWTYGKSSKIYLDGETFISVDEARAESILTDVKLNWGSSTARYIIKFDKKVALSRFMANPKTKQWFEMSLQTQDGVQIVTYKVDGLPPYQESKRYKGSRMSLDPEWKKYQKGLETKTEGFDPKYLHKEFTIPL